MVSPGTLPLVSVIVPCRNEARYIGACLDSILACDYPRERLEVLVADGASDDDTFAIVQQYAARWPCVRALRNPGRIASTGLNAGIRQAAGEVVVRMDAHVVYPANYLRALVTALLDTGADNVGGVIDTVPADTTPTACAIAVAVSHPLGVGNSYFRIGSATRRWVDTVPFGCYRRDVFDRIGLFDEELVRNQDDEFNFRLIAAGGRILLLPEVVATYYARATIRQTGRMFYQYGYFKPLVARKVGRLMTWRQVIPACFVLALAAGTALAPWFGWARWGLAVMLGLYLALLAGAAVRAAGRHGRRSALRLPAVIALLHLSYGSGFLYGLVAHFGGRRKPLSRTTTVPLSR